MYIGALEATANQATWDGQIQLIDVDDGEFIDITDCSITMTVADQKSKSIVLTGSTAAGEITMPEDGVFAWRFSKDRMSALCAGTYDVGIRISDEDEEITRQLVIGTVQVLDGIDRQ